MTTDDPARLSGYKEPCPCDACGAMAEGGYFDLAIHDCETGTWSYLFLTIPPDAGAP